MQLPRCHPTYYKLPMHENDAIIEMALKLLITQVHDCDPYHYSDRAFVQQL